MNPRFVALVPMRHHSERMPGKNYRSFASLPLYHHILNSLLACPLVSEVVIDTDSPTILEDASRNFSQVKLIQRPEHLRSGNIPMNEVLLYDVTRVDADFYLQTHSTNPLLRSETITRALSEFTDKFPVYDSLFSVTGLQTRLWDTQGRAVNHDPAVLLRTQDLEPIFMENSCLYVFSRNTLELRRNRIGERPLMFEIERSESWDIDEELDFEIAQFFFQRRQGDRR